MSKLAQKDTHFRTFDMIYGYFWGGCLVFLLDCSLWWPLVAGTVVRHILMDLQNFIKKTETSSEPQPDLLDHKKQQQNITSQRNDSYTIVYKISVAANTIYYIWLAIVVILISV